MSHNEINQGGYLDEFLDAQIMVGFGLTPSLVNFFDSIGVRVLDVEVSPLRFGRKRYWRARTTCPILAGLLQKIRLTDDAVARDVQSIAGAQARRRSVSAASGKRLGVVFGQTDIDLAIVAGGRIAAWEDEPILEKVRRLSAEVDELHITPHPAMVDRIDHIKHLLLTVPNAVLSGNRSYCYFFDQRIDFAAALSSSTLHEARCFGLTAHQLITPDRDNADLLPPSMTRWFDVGDGLFSPSFWAAVIDQDCDEFVETSPPYQHGSLVAEGLGSTQPLQQAALDLPAVVRPGQALGAADFSRLNLLGPGWHRAEREGVWSRASLATVSCHIDAARPVIVSFDLSVFAPAPVPPDVRVLVSGSGSSTSIRFAPDARGQLRRTVRLGFNPGGPSGTLFSAIFNVETPTSPLSAGLSDDARPLGVFLHGIEIGS